ncbi:acyltransferase [Candidatus Nanohalovita haloferacivicina]|uniref:acyltransferase n=1 Tax=Candidatus Nanohalovita haloferacivicina TaxID=2978046 RepID=UPI00325FDED9|nr:Acetyltransferase [Candidatus Nanohalobia archaeon BNXNv]
MSRKDRLEVHDFPGEKNSLRFWTDIFGYTRTFRNILLATVSRYLPIRAKNYTLRRVGVDLGSNCSIAFDATMDLFRPDLISIGDNTIVGYDSVILTHEALQDEMRIGEVEIGENVMIGARCIVLPGVKIGDGATVSAGSLVNRDVEEGEFVGGVPIENLGDRE